MQLLEKLIGQSFYKNNKTRSSKNFQDGHKNHSIKLQSKFKGKHQKFKSLLLDNNFEPARFILEELNEDTCKYMEGHPNEKESTFCGRKTRKVFVLSTSFNDRFQPKVKKMNQ